MSRDGDTLFCSGSSFEKKMDPSILIHKQTFLQVKKHYKVNCQHFSTQFMTS